LQADDLILAHQQRSADVHRMADLYFCGKHQLFGDFCQQKSADLPTTSIFTASYCASFGVNSGLLFFVSILMNLTLAVISSLVPASRLQQKLFLPLARV
jgi:hypothetical protein